MNNGFSFQSKAALFLLLLSFLTSYVNSQITIGDNTHLPDPSSALDIYSQNKGMLVPRLTTSQRAVISNPATGLLIYQTDGISGFYYYNGSIWILITSSLTNYWNNNLNDIYNNNSGNIGIGITAPSYKLDINGDVNATGNFKINGTNISSSQWITSGSKIYYNNGNVGIGSSSPVAKLEVIGGGVTYPNYVFSAIDDNGSRAFNVQYDGFSSFAGGMFKAGKVATDMGKYNIAGGYGFLGGTNATMYSGATINDINSDAFVFRNIGSTGRRLFDVRQGSSSYLTILPDGKTGIGTTAPSYVLDVNGDINTTGNFKINGTNINLSKWTTTGSNIYFNTGNVGIGTTAPGQKLTVTGTIESTINGFKFPDGTVQSTASGSGYWNANGSLLYYTGGNVGIGTTNPSSNLSVGSGSEFQVNTSGNIIKINNTTTNFPSSQGAAGTYLKNDGSGNLSWGTAATSSDSITFTSSGGLAIKLINKTGAATVKGTLVEVGSIDRSFTASSLTSQTSLGVVLESGIADGAETWVVTNGIAYVLLENNQPCTRGAIAITSSTTTGRTIACGTCNSSYHFQEIGHFLDSKSAGTNILVRVSLHFN